jgi:putative flippase GtrA
MTSLVQQASKFLTVGLIATAIHVGTAIILHNGTGVSALLANTIAFIIATMFSYAGNWIWTFQKFGTLKTTLPRFISLNLACFAVNQSIVFVVVEMMKLPLWLAMVPVVAIIPVFSFYLQKSRVFA